MTKNEFVEACSQAGYCRKEEAKYWAEKHPKASYDENDMVCVPCSTTVGRQQNMRPAGWCLRG